ncbi:MAG: FN3 domain-containing metallophosphoesterase family protein [Planctomycetota bacterium]
MATAPTPVLRWPARAARLALPLLVLGLAALLSGQQQDMSPDGDPGLRPYLHAPTPDSIWISWKTEPGDAAVVDWGPDGSALDRRTTGTTRVLSDTGYPANYAYHTVQLTGLQPSTGYRYRVRGGRTSSTLFRFRTPPAHGSDEVLRLLVLGDHQILASDRYERLVRAAADRVQARFGRRLEDSIHAVLNVGDQVDVGTLQHYEFLHFGKSDLISPFLPIMPLVGNHELYGSLGLQAYHDHFELDGMVYGAPSGTENYYSYQLGRVVVLALSTEHTGTPQETWARQVIDAADADPDVDWILTLGHRPSIAEQYIGDISTWVRDRIQPRLEQSPKAALVIGGHHHLYARGQRPEAPLYHIISGGTAWDQRWGMSTERDFQEVQKTIDYWPFQIIEFFPAERRMRVETHAIGNALVSLDSELIDVFERTLGDPAPETPTITALGTGPLQLPLTIESSAFVQPAGHELHSTWFQVAPTAAFAEVEIDVHRAFENLYGTTGPPDYDPVDLHAGIDLLRSEIPANALINGQHFVRVRHRDKNLEWSAWSDAVPFTVEGSVGGYPEIALDAATYDVGAPIRITYEHGPGNADVWIGLYRDGDVPGQIPSRTWSYVNGTSGAVTLSLDEPGPYYAAFFESGGYGELAARVPFYVGPVPDLDVDPHFVLSGADVRVEFTNAPALADDWIGAYRVGEVPSTVGSSSWQYVQAAAGVMALNGLSDGLYFAGYFLRDGYTEAGPRTYFVVGPSPVTVATDAATYAATGTIEVTFGGGPGTEGDWFGVFPAGSEPSEVSVAAMIPIPGAADGRVDLPAVGFTAGDHQVALFVDGSYHEVSNRASFTVLP